MNKIKKAVGIICDGSFGLSMMGLGTAHIIFGIRIIKWIIKESYVLDKLLGMGP